MVDGKMVENNILTSSHNLPSHHLILLLVAYHNHLRLSQLCKTDEMVVVETDKMNKISVIYLSQLTISSHM